MYPEAEIKALPLGFPTANEENTKRRNCLYNSIGLINYTGQKTLSELTPFCSTRGFCVIDLHEFLNNSLANQSFLSKNQNRLESVITLLHKENLELRQRTLISTIFTCITILLSIPVHVFVRFQQAVLKLLKYKK